MAKPWIKVYQETLENDPKLSDIDNDGYGIFIKLILVANEVGKNGLIPGSASRGGYNRANLAKKLKTTPDNLQKVIRKLSRKYDIPASSQRYPSDIPENNTPILKRYRNGDIMITNYKKRQAKPPSAEREAVAERVKKHREPVTSL